MDDKSYIREKKKRQLRQNVIQMVPQDEQELSKEYKDLGRRKIRIVAVRVIVIASILIGIFFAWGYYKSYHLYETYEEVWSQEIPEGAASNYIAFGENVLKYTRDGASYIKASGAVIWDQPYEMKNPIAVANGSYVAIADKKGNSIFICNKEGMKGSLITNLPILKVVVSSHGVVAVILEDTEVNPVKFYYYEGTELVSINTSISNEGNYPLDISISPEGTKLMVSYVYLDGGILQGQVVFYDFSEKGKSKQGQLVGLFKEGSTIIPKVQFLTDDRACAFRDNGLIFYSLKNALSPEIINTHEITSEIDSIFYSSNYVGIIVKEEEEGGKYELQVFSSSGTLIFKENIDFKPGKAEFGKDVIMLWNSTDCLIFNMKGVKKYSGTFDFEIIQMAEGQLQGNFIITGTKEMKQIKLK